MIQQQTQVDIADNTGAKEGMCIKVLRGSSSKGKFKRKVAHVGDIIICAVKKTLPGGDVKMACDHSLRRRSYQDTALAGRMVRMCGSTATRPSP